MIKKLKRKLIFIALLSVSIVIGIILFSSYAASMMKITRSADKLIDILAENNGVFPEPNSKLDVETIMKTRYFTFKTYDDNSKEDEFDISKNFIEMNDAKLIAKKADRRLLNSGYIKSYRYHRHSIEGGDLYIFVNCKGQINAVSFLISAAILISLLGLLTIFSLLQLFSLRFLRPIIDAYEKQKKFITNASHELKTPLTVITANSELLEMEYGSNEYTETINRQVSKLTSMTNTLITLSKIDEITMLNDFSQFSLTEVAYDYATEFEKVFCVKFDYQIQEEINYHGNEKLIRNLFSILLDNARKYSLSYVNLKVEKSKNKIHIFCENDSLNLEKGDLNFFTERFFRQEESRINVLDGTGIGLSLAKEITLMHKGSIKISSPDGKVCIVHITI